jgi:diguanylate cyclase (GGDEF)-like protein
MLVAGLVSHQMWLVSICVPGSIGFVIAWALVRRGAVLWSVYAVVITATLLVTSSSAIGAGIRSPAVLAYPVIIIFAGMTLRGHRYFSALAIVVISMAFLVGNQVFGWIPFRTAPNPVWIDVLSTTVIISATTYAVWLLAESARDALATAHGEIARRRKIERELEILSSHDHLTGVFNRRFFEAEANRLKTSRHEFVSIIVADIDGLKDANDRFGHAAGDHLIIDTAELLGSMVRVGDVLARTGGDEFAILLPDTDAVAAAEAVARIEESAALRQPRNPDAVLSLSVGAATAGGAQLDETMATADARMYEKKHAKRRRQVVSDNPAPESPRRAAGTQPATQG